MSTAAPVDAVDVGRPDPGTTGASGPDDPGDRGGLSVADRVVERVAGYAATQVPGAGAAPRRVLGVDVGDARPDREAAVQARVDGRTATVQATIAVEWPRSVREVVRRFREHVHADVQHLTGVQVAHVDVEVVDLPAPAAAARRVR